MADGRRNLLAVAAGSILGGYLSRPGSPHPQAVYSVVLLVLAGADVPANGQPAQTSTVVARPFSECVPRRSSPFWEVSRSLVAPVSKISSPV